MKVRVSTGMTINLGDHQFAKVNVEIEKEFQEDVDPTEAVDVVYEIAEAAVMEKVDTLISRAEREGLLR